MQPKILIGVFAVMIVVQISASILDNDIPQDPPPAYISYIGLPPEPPMVS